MGPDFAPEHLLFASVVAITFGFVFVRDLLPVWGKECVGSALIVLTTCSVGPILGPLGGWYEWGAFHAAVVLTDFFTGAHVNPAVTVAFFTYGHFGGAELLMRVLAQCTGGCFGWMLLKSLLGTYFSLSIGGPSTAAGVPTGDAAISEGFATFLLLCAICLVSETALGRNYWVNAPKLASIYV